MIIEEYIMDNTKVKFYDDEIVKNIATQKKYIDNSIANLVRNFPLL